MKIPTCGALRCANGTLRQVYCFLEISLLNVTTQPALTPFLNAHRAIPLSQSGRGVKTCSVPLFPTWEKG
jgi:hypothetical protein